MNHTTIFTPESVARQLIKDSKMSLRQLEQLTGITRVKLSRFGNGSATLTVSDAFALASALKQPMSVFFPVSEAIYLQNEPVRNTSQQIMDGLEVVTGGQLSARGDREGIEAIVALYFASNKSLLRAGQATKRKMVQFEAGNNVPRPLDVGDCSLTAERLGTDLRAVQDYVYSQTEDVLGSYIEVTETQMPNTFYRTVRFQPKVENPFMLHYMTTLLPERVDGKNLVWNYSKLIWARPATEDELEVR